VIGIDRTTRPGAIRSILASKVDMRPWRAKLAAMASARALSMSVVVI
jgi:hypothetical protein